MDGDGASHLGHGRSWVCVGLMVAGFTGAGVALTLGPAWVWVAVGAAVFVLGGCLALGLGITDDTVTEERLAHGAGHGGTGEVGPGAEAPRPAPPTGSTAADGDAPALGDEQEPTDAAPESDAAGTVPSPGESSPPQGTARPRPTVGTAPPPPREEATPEELGRFCLAAIRREFGPPGRSPEGDHMRWRVQDAVWRLRDLPPEEGEHEDARASLAEVHRRCLEFGTDG